MVHTSSPGGHTEEADARPFWIRSSPGPPGPQICKAQEGAGPPWRPGCGLMQGHFSPGPCFPSHKEEVKLSYLEGPSTSEKSLRIHAHPCGQYSVCTVSVDSISWGGRITNQGKVSTGRRNVSRTHSLPCGLAKALVSIQATPKGGSIPCWCPFSLFQ